MRRLILPAVLALAACDPAPPAPPAPEPAPAPAPAPAAWAATSEGVLAWVDEDEARRFALSCDAGVLRVHAPWLARIGSEDRLTVGAGDEAFALVADLASPEAGVTASGPVPADFLARLARGEAIGLVYGAQPIGPVPAPEAAVLGPFVDACAA